MSAGSRRAQPQATDREVLAVGGVVSRAARGAIAGAAGTLAMDLVWYRRYRRSGGTDSFLDWEFSTGTDSYENAAAPAQVGKRVVEGLFDTQLKPDTAGFTNNVVHWATGVGWGALHGLVVGSTPSASPAAGLATGATAWLTAYGVLGAAKLYQPMWKYDVVTLGKDLSAHLLFGLGTGAAFRALLAGRNGGDEA